MSLLPQRIIPQTVPFGRVTADGLVTIQKEWWLLLYNLCANSSGTSTELSTSDLTVLLSAEADAADADAVTLRLPIAALVNLIPTEPDSVPFQQIRNALILAQDGLLPGPQPIAQPSQAITIGASPYTYTVNFNGAVASSGGTVTAIDLIRQGTTVPTGITAGVIPVSRGDQIKWTYAVAPTANFLPT